MLTEKDWSVLDSCTPYEKSKLLAEQSAWEFVKNLSGMIRQYGDKQYFILFYSALPLGQGHHNSVSQFLWAHPVNFPCSRKPEYPKKTHDFRQSVDYSTILFSHEDWVRLHIEMNLIGDRTQSLRSERQVV